MTTLVLWLALFFTLCQAQTIRQKRDELGGLAFTGAIVGENLEGATPFTFQMEQQYENGVIVYSPTWGTKWIGKSKAMRDAWLTQKSLLGPPVEDAKKFDRSNTPAPSCVFDKQIEGYVSYCERGAIVEVTSTTPPKTVVVDSVYYLKWQSMKSVSGDLGPPVAFFNDLRTFNFYCGDIVAPNPNIIGRAGISFAVVDPFRKKWNENLEALGEPISDAEIISRPRTASDPPTSPATVVIGKMQRFQTGAIYEPSASPARQFALHGPIWREYETTHRGTLGLLGFPTSDVSPYGAQPTSTFFAEFQGGVLVSYDTQVRLFTELEVYVDTFSTRGNDCVLRLCGHQDLYVRATITARDGGPSAPNLVSRLPGGGDYGGDERLDRVLLSVPVRSAYLSLQVKFEGWDADRFGGDDRLGTYDRTYTLPGKWGLDEGLRDQWTGDFKAQVAIRAKPYVDPNKEWRQNFFWNFRNFGTKTLSYDQYADTFRDVDYDRSWLWHPFNNLFYETVYKSIADGGNCFGMALSAVRSQLDISPYSTPVDQHADTPNARLYINRFHGYQLGAANILYSVIKVVDYITNKRSHARQEALRAQDFVGRGQRPILVLVKSTLGYDGGHVVQPYEFDFSQPNNWVIRIADPNVPYSVSPNKNAVRNTLTVNSRTGEWKLGTGTDYSSDQGSWFYCIPFSILASPPITPFGALLHQVFRSGMVVVSGDADVTQVTDLEGKPLYKGSGRSRPSTWSEMESSSKFQPTTSVVRIPSTPNRYLDLFAEERGSNETPTEGTGDSAATAAEVGSRRRRELLQLPSRSGVANEMYYLRYTNGTPATINFVVKARSGNGSGRYKVSVRTARGTYELDAPATPGSWPEGYDTISLHRFNLDAQNFGIVAGTNKTVSMTFIHHERDNRSRPIKVHKIVNLQLRAGVKVFGELRNGGKELILISFDGRNLTYGTIVQNLGPGNCVGTKGKGAKSLPLLC